MAQDILVREANLSDVPILVGYNQALASETENITLNEDTLRLGVETVMIRKDCHYFVAELNGEIVGQSMITSEWSDWRNGVMWWIQSVYVNPNHRKNGVFTSILNYVETLVEKNREVKALRLYVTQSNKVGISTYENLGMKNTNYLVYEKSQRA